MSTAEKVILVLHLLGFAALFGGAFLQLRDPVKVVNVSMLYGALAQIVTGLLLVGVIEGQGDDVDHTKAGVKLAIALVIALLCWVNRAKERIPDGLFHGIWLLTVANVCVAVFW